MQIGIGHPGTIPGVKGQLILEWARKADAGPFSSLESPNGLRHHIIERRRSDRLPG